MCFDSSCGRNPSPYPIRTFVKALFFTVGFTGCTCGSAAIWQYTTSSLKYRVQGYLDGTNADWLESIRLQKEDNFRKEINKWRITSVTARTVADIVAAEGFFLLFVEYLLHRGQCD